MRPDSAQSVNMHVSSSSTSGAPTALIKEVIFRYMLLLQDSKATDRQLLASLRLSRIGSAAESRDG